MRKILEVIKVVGLGSFYGAYILTGLTRFTGLRLVGGLVRVREWNWEILPKWQWKV